MSKVRGEAVTGEADFGIDPKVLDRIAVEVGQLVDLGVEIGMVIGGGNLFRGAALHGAGMDRVTGDHMGMLATVMNALAMRDALENSSKSSPPTLDDINRVLGEVTAGAKLQAQGQHQLPERYRGRKRRRR